MVVQVLAGSHWVTAAIFFQAAVNRWHHLLQTLDSITHVAWQALTPACVLEGPDDGVVRLKGNCASLLLFCCFVNPPLIWENKTKEHTKATNLYY